MVRSLYLSSVLIMVRIQLVCAGLVLLGCAGSFDQNAIDDNYKREIEEWRVELHDGRANYLKLAGLFKMDEPQMSLGRASSNNMILPAADAPANIGSFDMTSDTIIFSAAPGINVTDNTDKTISKVALTLDTYGNSELLYTGSLRWRVIRRGGGPYLRVWDENNPAVADFKGYESFTLDPKAIFDARFEYYPDPQKDSVQSKLGVTESTQFIGRVVFEKGGSEHSLDVGNGGFTMVGDETTGAETYGGGRYMYLDLPTSDSAIVLDFNYLYNPPCAFSEYTTCLIPPPQNRLPFKILSGEKLIVAD